LKSLELLGSAASTDLVESVLKSAQKAPRAASKEEKAPSAHGRQRADQIRWLIELLCA
jgi:hypothetical protein